MKPGGGLDAVSLVSEDREEASAPWQRRPAYAPSAEAMAPPGAYGRSLRRGLLVVLRGPRDASWL